MNDPVNFVDPSGLVGMVYGKDGAASAGGGGRISGFTKHGLNRTIGDGYSRQGVCNRALNDAVKNPISTVNQSNGLIRYNGSDATVILTQDGKVITTWPNNSNGERGSP